MVAFTFFFQEIFSSYDDWKQFFENNSTIVDYTDPLEAQFDNFCYNILTRHFHNVNIRYDTISAFLSELLNVYENKFKQFLNEKKVIDAISQLTIEDYQIVSKGLTNMANNPNDDVEDPTQPLNYISAQTYNQIESNKLKAYLDALNNMPSLNVYKFLKPNNPNEMGFTDLFMNVQPNIKYVYSKGGK